MRRFAYSVLCVGLVLALISLGGLRRDGDTAAHGLGIGSSHPGVELAHGPMMEPNGGNGQLAHGPMMEPNGGAFVLAHGPMMEPNGVPAALVVDLA